MVGIPDIPEHYPSGTQCLCAMIHGIARLSSGDSPNANHHVVAIRGESCPSATRLHTSGDRDTPGVQGIGTLLPDTGIGTNVEEEDIASLVNVIDRLPKSIKIGAKGLHGTRCVGTHGVLL